MSVCCECCVLSLRRADHSSRGVLPSVVCLSVIEEPQRGCLGPLGLSSHEKKDKNIGLIVLINKQTNKNFPNQSAGGRTGSSNNINNVTLLWT
jgi:hypothetical protein